MMTRVMLTPASVSETKLRVDADLGLGFRALPPFEQERRIERVLEEARDRIVALVGGPERQTA